MSTFFLWPAQVFAVAMIYTYAGSHEVQVGSDNQTKAS